MEPLSIPDRISIEKQIGILKDRLQCVEGDTAEQWQRDAHPELVEQKQTLRARIEELENRLLS